ncbi:MAG: ECF transporter S component [Firmicutes bacterium]|nr:ECF transporter S component [Bacillota bacterium]
MKQKIRWITRTAVFLALLVVLQSVTKPAGQIVTGSCVNAVLAVSVLCAGLASGLTVALLSPLFAFLLGIGPAFFPLTPVIAVGNAVFVSLLWLLAGRKQNPLWKTAGGMAAASSAKFLCLYFLVVEGVCRFAELKPQQVKTFTTMFSFPQLITALIGCAVAWIIVPIVTKAMNTTLGGKS